MAELRELVIVWLAAKPAGEGMERVGQNAGITREAGGVDWAQQLRGIPE